MCYFFFFNDTATTEIYTLSLHDALPISPTKRQLNALLGGARIRENPQSLRLAGASSDRKSTRLNSSHSQISYAVFCLKKKKKSPTPIALFSHVRPTPERFLTSSHAQDPP